MVQPLRQIRQERRDTIKYRLQGTGIPCITRYVYPTGPTQDT